MRLEHKSKIQSPKPKNRPRPPPRPRNRIPRHRGQGRERGRIFSENSTREDFQLTCASLVSCTNQESPENLPLPPVNTGGDHPYALFQNRDFRLYLAGRLVAVLGQQMLTVAVGWELYERTGSPLALGIVGLVEMIAMVCCTLPAGHLADNVNRKRIILPHCWSVPAPASDSRSFRGGTRRSRGFMHACSQRRRRGPFCGPPTRPF